MLKAHKHPNRNKRYPDVGLNSGSSVSSEDVSRDVVGHLDVGRLVGSYFGSVLTNYTDSPFPEHEQVCEFVISTGDLCRAVMDHPDIKGWWRHYLLTRRESYIIATPYLATIPIIYAPNTWPSRYDDDPIAYSGESIMAVNMTVDKYSGAGGESCDGSCTRTPAAASLEIYRIDEDGNESSTTENFTANQTKIITPADTDLSVVNHVLPSATGDNEPSFVLFVFQSEDDVHADIPLRVTP